MKYIRTKDGRIVDVSLMQEFETDDDNGKPIFDGYEDKDGTYYPVENIIKQSDNLAEVCDYVWYKEKHHEPKLERICSHVAKAMKQPRIDGAFEYVRFMILVGKDLKTVAEMNKKGEVEWL